MRFVPLEHRDGTVVKHLVVQWADALVSVIEVDGSVPMHGGVFALQLTG